MQFILFLFDITVQVDIVTISIYIFDEVKFMVKRELWLKKIRPFYENELIKVLIGIRRSGKSIILKQIQDELLTNGVNSDHIIFINFEDLDFSFIKNETDLHSYIKPQIVDDKKYYLFFDEIQNVKNFEKVLNSLRATQNVSIFITGSNVNLLSGELATLLAGRYVTFKIMPFTFAECLQIQNITNPTDSDLMNYLKFGGMPQRFYLSTESEIKIFLSDLYDSIVLKDIISRYKVKNVELLDKIINYLASTSSQIFSASSINNFFKNEGRECSKETLYNYLSYVVQSCVVNKAKRYDISGKKTLSTLEKYYLADTGFANLHSLKFDIGAMLENVVYNELIARGYEIQVGVTANSEIDFIATKDGQKEYYQVAYILHDENTIKREFGVYQKVKDNFPKFVISADHFDFSQDGIIHKNIIQWLLEK